MVIYQTNFNYELELFKNLIHSKQPSSLINSQFEYLFFWVENTIHGLFTQNHYDLNYLNYIKSIRKAIPTIISHSDSPIKNWWGLLENREIEQKLNSKITSAQFAIQNNLCHEETKIIHHWDEIIKCLNNSQYSQWILKSPYLFSGKGFFKFNHQRVKETEFKTKIKNTLKKHPLIFDPFLSRIHDFGITLNPGTKVLSQRFVTQNLIGANGQYRGGLLFQDNKSVTQLNPKSLKIIASHYQKIGAHNLIEIDYFTYKEGNKKKTYQLVEVNYRKTMGHILNGLNRLNLFHEIGCFLIFNRHSLKTKNKYEFEILPHRYTEIQKKGPHIISLSPKNTLFSSFFLTAKDTHELNDLIKILWSYIGKENRPLPLDYLCFD